MQIEINMPYGTSKVEVQGGHYKDGSQAIQLFNVEEHEYEMTATVCLAGDHLIPEPGNVFIKNWSENTGILSELIRHKIISEPVQQVSTGFVTVDECKLLVNLAD